MNIKKQTELPPGVKIQRIEAGPEHQGSPFWRKTGWSQKNAEKRLKNEDRAREVCAQHGPYFEDEEE